jgi:hypothetical protein
MSRMVRRAHVAGPRGPVASWGRGLDRAAWLVPALVAIVSCASDVARDTCARAARRTQQCMREAYWMIPGAGPGSSSVAPGAAVEASDAIRACATDAARVATYRRCLVARTCDEYLVCVGWSAAGRSP